MFFYNWIVPKISAPHLDYRAIKRIPNGKELLTWYGQSYAQSLGIDIAKVDCFKGEENHKSEGFPCTICNNQFSTAEALQTHQMNQNSCRKKLGKPKRNFSCTSCDQSFDSFAKLKLKDHQILHDRWASKSFTSLDKQCPLCFKMFSQNVNMQVHYDTVHAKKKDHKCPTCGKEFGMKSDLNRHVQTVHNLVRSHICPECGASFGRAGDLRKHRESTHLGIR